MSKIRLITDTTSSLTKKECEERNIECLETSYMLDDELHYGFDEDVPLKEFYNKLNEAKKVSTGCVNTDAFEAIFDRVASEGDEAIYIGLSSALSATYGNAVVAANNVNEKYGRNAITVIDSRSGSYGELIFIDKIEELINEGKTAQEIKEIIDADVANSAVAFVAPDLSFICKCGRLSALEAKIGNLLKLVPIISPSQEDGKLKVVEKGIGMKLTMKKLKTRFVDFIKKRNHTRCYLASCDMDKEIEEIRQYILDNTDIKPENIKVGYIDKTMSCCCGPRTISIFCI